MNDGASSALASSRGTDEVHCGPVVSLGVRGHEKVLGFGHLRSQLVATKVPAFGAREVPPTEVST